MRFGWLSDLSVARGGGRRPWVVAGLIALAASYPALVLARNPVELVAAVALAQAAINAVLAPLFAIIADLFRDHKLSGWLKAVWVFFLLFLPILTALVYLVARGEGMTERSNKAARDAEKAAADTLLCCVSRAADDRLELDL
ncbi:PLDc N-terminal domain-containing protein [Aeromicrobium sp. REDSEA-S32_B7]|uniref:PLDc N-terminal domain-containing protein n=1 Tax=Aeromicrobium sp. REDSEA-S32_B7 TaxID=1811526 RepID=UPI000AB704D2|nr:PLDc N-terminal domain-containing protein [Aeromicrobium sp. REDSEA-S32_B7]